ncbi:MAG: RluA family pseudouridine synthase [Sphingomicrobium sp.]
MAEPRLFTVSEDDDGIRLDRWFKRHKPEISFNIVSRWARTGQLRLDGKRVAPGDRIEAGQQIRVPPADAEPQKARRAKPSREPLTPEEAEFVRSLVIYEDEHAFVLNKPPGLATQGGTKTSNHLDRLLDGLADDAGNRPKLVHRLDKDTSGVILVARTARAAAYFSKSFSGRTAKKIYWALVIGVPSPDEGLIDAPLAKQPGTGGEKMHVDEEQGQPAKTRWRLVDRAGNRAAWVELQPLTGRTHQLRAHMTAMANPIIGDGKYGGAEAFLTGGVSRKLHLHARRLKIGSPGGGSIDVTADLPDHFAQSLEMLGFEAAAGERIAVPRPKRQQAAKPRRESRRGERRARGTRTRR